MSDGRGAPGVGKKIAFTAVTMVFFLVGFVLLMEIAVRLFVPPAMWRFRDASHDWQPDPRLGWTNKADMDHSWRPEGEIIRYRTNPDGLIPFDATPKKPPGTVRVMAFGDSMVVGRSVPQEQIYTARLEDELRKRGVAADVVNAGVLGYATDQSLLLMERMLPIYQPDVVLFGHTLNDLGGNSTRNAYSQPKPMFVLEEGKLRLIPPEPSDRIQTRGSGWRSWLQASASYRIVQPKIQAFRASLMGWRERSLLGLEHAVYVYPDSLERFDWELLSAMLARMKRSAEARGARFVFFAHPEAAEVWDPYIEAISDELGVSPDAYDRYAVDERLARAARRAGVPYLSVLHPFIASQPRGLLHMLPYDGHLSPAGHQLMAELLAEHLVEEVLPGDGRHGGARGQEVP